MTLVIFALLTLVVGGVVGWTFAQRAPQRRLPGSEWAGRLLPAPRRPVYKVSATTQYAGHIEHGPSARRPPPTAIPGPGSRRSR